MDAHFLVTFDDLGDGLLRARVTGVRSLETTVGYWEAILQRVSATGPTRLLVSDELSGEELSASEWKRLVEEMKGRGLEGVRIAHVKPFAFDQISYCERYAREAGLEARAFRRESEARTWLDAPAG
jgi:hypothetical protein